MKDFQLKDAFRYLLPGVMFLLVVGVCYPDIRRYAFARSGLFDAAVLTGLGLAVGTLLYSLVRAVLYPFTSRSALHVARGTTRGQLRRRLTQQWAPTSLELEWWSETFELKQGEEIVVSALQGWGARVQSLYASSLGILAGAYGPLLVSCPGCASLAGFRPCTRAAVGAVIGGHGAFHNCCV